MPQGKSRKLVKTFLDVPRWVGVNEIVTVGKTVKDLGKRLVTPQQAERQETYEQAVKRLNLSQEDIDKRCRYWRMTSYVYLFSALCFLGYSIHLFLLEHYASSLTTLVFIAVLLAFAFREHFWYTQMKRRRLGFTFQEWLSELFKS